jgi:hypothetical protein
MNKNIILADILVAVMGTICLMFAFNSPAGLIHDFALIYGGICIGYVCTTYLNEEKLNDQ